MEIARAIERMISDGDPLGGLAQNSAPSFAKFMQQHGADRQYKSSLRASDVARGVASPASRALCHGLLQGGAESRSFLAARRQ